MKSAPDPSKIPVFEFSRKDTGPDGLPMLARGRHLHIRQQGEDLCLTIAVLAAQLSDCVAERDRLRAELMAVTPDQGRVGRHAKK